MNKPSPEVEISTEIVVASVPVLQQSASLYCQIIQRHLQLRNRRADFRACPNLLLQGL